MGARSLTFLRAGGRYAMSHSNTSTPLYLDELQIGQRFTSASLTVTGEAMKAFAREFDPQPFHISEASAEHTLFRGLAASGWHTAALSMRLNVEGGLPSQAESSVQAVTLPGQHHCARGTRSMSRTRCPPLHRRALALIEASSPSSVERSIRTASRYRPSR
jgi:hypothetical protein